MNGQKTAEHLAWENLKVRLEEVNRYAGNRAENTRFTKMMDEAWEKARRKRDDT